MIGMEEYPMLGIENAEEQYHAQIGMLAEVSGDTIMGLWGRNQSVYGSIHWMSN